MTCRGWYVGRHEFSKKDDSSIELKTKIEQLTQVSNTAVMQQTEMQHQNEGLLDTIQARTQPLRAIRLDALPPRVNDGLAKRCAERGLLGASAGAVARSGERVRDRAGPSRAHYTAAARGRGQGG